MIVLREKKFDEILYQRSPDLEVPPRYRDYKLRRGTGHPSVYRMVAEEEANRGPRILGRSRSEEIALERKVNKRALELRKGVLKESLQLRHEGKTRYPSLSDPQGYHYAATESAQLNHLYEALTRKPKNPPLTFGQKLGRAKDSIRLKYKREKPKAEYIISTPTHNRKVKSIQEALERGAKTSVKTAAKRAKWLRI